MKGALIVANERIVQKSPLVDKRGRDWQCIDDNAVTNTLFG